MNHTNQTLILISDSDNQVTIRILYRIYMSTCRSHLPQLIRRRTFDDSYKLVSAVVNLASTNSGSAIKLSILDLHITGLLDASKALDKLVY